MKTGVRLNDRQLILYQFSREKVERGDFSAFLSQFGADWLPSGPALAGMMGTMAFAVEGYDADSRKVCPAAGGRTRAHLPRESLGLSLVTKTPAYF